MENIVKNFFKTTRGIIVNHNAKGSNRIRFLLPNGYMNCLRLVSYKQQFEINKAIKIYVKGKAENIEWSMVGINNFQDVINGYENYCNNNDTFFDDLITEIHIEGVSLLGNEIIFNLNGQKMNELDAQWQYKLAYDLKKYDHMFHEFESVIIETTTEIDENKNKNKNKVKDTKRNTNNNKNKTKTNKKNNNRSTNKNEQKIENKNSSFNELLNVWEKECKNIQNELTKRDSEQCKCLDETFGILTKIENMLLKLKMNFLKDSDENMSILNQLERARNLDLDFKRDILNVKNKIELIEASLINEKIEMDERLKNKLETVKFWNDNNVCENVFEQQQIMIDHSLTTDKMVAECDRTMSKYIQNINTTKIQFENSIHQCKKDAYESNKPLSIFNGIVLNMEWNILKKFVNNILVYGLNGSISENYYSRIIEFEARITAEDSNFVGVCDNVVFSASESVPGDILLQHTNADLLNPTNKIDTGDSLISQTNDLFYYVSSLINTHNNNNSDNNISYLINTIAIASETRLTISNNCSDSNENVLVTNSGDIVISILNMQRTNDSYVQNESNHCNKSSASNSDGNNNCLIGKSNFCNENCYTQSVNDTKLTVQGFDCHVQGFDCQITFYDNGG